MAGRIEVVAAVIFRGSEVLACRRMEGKSAAGMWEFPGGKVEPGESQREALEREIKEELGVAVEVHDLLLNATTSVGEVQIELACYRCELTGETPAMSSDHDLLVWQPIGRLDDLKWADPDLPMVSVLQARR